MRIDLHTHSRVSDGTESPADLVRSARAAGLDALALTDHDTTAGWDEARAAARENELELLPGMEVSCAADGIAVHLLAYGPDPEAEGLFAEIARARSARLDRAQEMVGRLSEDYPIDWDDVCEHVGEGATVGRPHIADALVAAGVVEDRTEAFGSILAGRSRYYVPHYAPYPAQAVRLVREAGGVPVFAHPLASARGRVVGEEVFDRMVEAGLAGVEVFHRDNPPEAREKLLAYAAENDLLVTGSSDYHGTGKPNRLGENTTDPEVFQEIRRRARVPR